MKQSVVCAASVLLIVLSASVGYSQTTGGVAAKVSTLGYGFDGAVSVTEKSNVRVGFNFLNFNHDFDNDGITLAAHLKLRSVTAAFDWFPFVGGFHVSPGIMIYNGNRVEAEALVPAGRTFDLGNDKLLEGGLLVKPDDDREPCHRPQPASPIPTCSW